MSIMFILSKRGKIKQHALSEILFLEKSSVSRNMQRLYEKGYVSKKDFPEIEITDKGLTLLDAIIPQWDKAMKEAREKMGAEGEEALDVVFNKLIM